jgi:hypothetical protein
MKKYWLIALVPYLFTLPVTTWAADSSAASASKSQKDKTLKGSLTLTSRAEIKSLGTREVRVTFKKEGITSLGILQYSKEGINWVPAQAAPVKLPHKLSTLVAANGRAVLQYGDSTNRQHPAKIDLFFIDENGVEMGRVLDRYGPQTNIVMAEDGHVAVAGSLFSDAKRTEIGLYTATGEKRFQVQLAEGRRANIAVATSQGQRVAVFTTDTKDYLANHRLEIFDGSGKKIAEQQGLGILQKAVAVANGSMFFVQAKRRFGLVNSNDGSLLWTRNEVLRLISPHGAATDPQGKTLFLAAAEWDGMPKARYKWRIEVRDVATGNEFARFVLPDTFPSNEGRVFLNVTSEQIELLSGDERIVLDWRRP